jgi:hypothetical protein
MRLTKRKSDKFRPLKKYAVTCKNSSTTAYVSIRKY